MPQIFVTDVAAKMQLLYGTIELSWQNPSTPEFSEVAVYRKINDYPTSELDPYATLVYRGTAEKIYDYKISGPATTDFGVAARAVIGEYNSNTGTYENKVPDPLLSDVIYYYTVFSIDTTGVYTSSFVTSTTCRVNKEHGLFEAMYSYLPAFYKVEDRKGELKRFLQAITPMYDYLKTNADNMSHFIDIDKCEPYQLDYIAHLLDWELDKTLPIPSQRQTLKNAVNVYKLAGTRKGLDLLVKMNSGFPGTSGVLEGRDYTAHSVYFGYFPTDAVRYDYATTPDLTALDPTKIGTATDPLKYVSDFRSNVKQDTDRFIAYVQKSTQISAEQETAIRNRLTRLLNRFAPGGTKFDIEIY
jgi:phage tail-like protein